MGGALSALRDALGGDDQLQASDALNSLETLANTKMAEFYDKVESGVDSHLIPIHKVVAKFYFMQGKAATDTSGLSNQISKLIGDIAGGHWADAIVDAATDIIQDLLGSSSASVEEETSYMVSVNELGGVERLDVYYFAYAFTSQKLVTNVQNVVASVVVKSSVQIDDIDDNTLRVLVNNSFPTLSADVRIQLYEQLCLIIPKSPPSETVQNATKAMEAILLANPPASKRNRKPPNKTAPSPTPFNTPKPIAGFKTPGPAPPAGPTPAPAPSTASAKAGPVSTGNLGQGPPAAAEERSEDAETGEII